MSDSPAPISLARVGALFILSVGVVLWSSYHLGIGPKDLGWLAPVVAAAGVAAGVAKRFVTDEHRATFGRMIGVLTTTAFLLIATAVVLLLVFTRSFVTVIGATSAEEGSVTITALDGRGRAKQESLGPNLKPAQFYAVGTSPFGRSYRIDAKGYVPATFEVYPLTGLRLRLGRDIALEPAVLFRPPPSALGFLADSGMIRVYARSGNDRTLLAEGKGDSSFLLGRDQSIPPALIEDWKLELTDLGDPNPTSTLLKWKRFKVLTTEAQLAPGSILEVEIVSRALVPVASGTVQLSGGRLNDVLLTEVIQ